MSANNVMPKIALFFAMLLIFALVVVFGIFGLAMLSQSVAFMFQSGTILLIQCTSSIVILALLGLLVYLFWRQQKLQTMLFAALRNDAPSQLIAQNRQAAVFLPAENQDDIVEFLPDQQSVELSQSPNSWQGRSPWEC